MADTKMEFAVQMTCKSCEEAVKAALNVPGINSVYVDVPNEVVIVETSLPSSNVHKLLESTGKLIVFRGFGGQEQAPTSHQGAAVVVMKGSGPVNGLLRMVQVSSNECVIEGTIDGLTPNKEHLLKIHDHGDLSNGCESCGDVYNVMMSKNGKSVSHSLPPVGDIAALQSDGSGRISFQTKSERVKVYDVIGRSMILHSSIPSVYGTRRLMCGIIARSAGLFQNTKKVCTCDGVTIWDEAASQRQK
ncbi:PREDICTED: copper chaperone for superoxide dismutase-like [Amphimedon queenslandica]|uniref:Superoxide dismutase copper chaperone n=1 Tax=Amphimedon queenslandica TaxID=400682 RepID=A0A1X7UXW8_AMPQE|nr:PREDICTED: copper chaperone for superoxide dismutase-like [Amphimedon queenslandica]|eukprot:XP_003386470.2 PREDICTED: copper chaperone for superoxide dismutase-like [Amphimedon queenslandica]